MPSTNYWMPELIVERREGQDAAYAATHELYGYATFGTLSRARQVNLHYRLALALDNGVDTDRERYLASAAYHWHAAGRSGDTSRALKRCEAAGDLALERTAYADADRPVRPRARRHRLVGRRRPLRRVALLAKRAEANHRAGNPQGRERDAEAAVEMAASVGDALTLCRAALVHGGLRSTYGIANTRTTALLARAYDSVPEGNDALRARVCARLAQEHYHGGDYEAARQLSAEGRRARTGAWRRRDPGGGIPRPRLDAQPPRLARGADRPRRRDDRTSGGRSQSGVGDGQVASGGPPRSSRWAISTSSTSSSRCSAA